MAAMDEQEPKKRKERNPREWIPFDALPLFVNDRELALALLGPKRANQWSIVVLALVRMGLPPIDPLMGGRYTPAVKSFLDRIYNPGGTGAAARPDGVEGKIEWRKPRRPSFKKDDTR
jgi:hypothetical protein